MIVYEFYLKEEFMEQAFQSLCDSFYGVGVEEPFKRKVDDTEGSAVYSVSRNALTMWVQLLVDDNTPEPIIRAIEARINGLCDTTFSKYASADDHVAPMERPRVEIGI